MGYLISSCREAFIFLANKKIFLLFKCTCIRPFTAWLPCKVVSLCTIMCTCPNHIHPLIVPAESFQKKMKTQKFIRNCPWFAEENNSLYAQNLFVKRCSNVNRHTYFHCRSNSRILLKAFLRLSLRNEHACLIVHTRYLFFYLLNLNKPTQTWKSRETRWALRIEETRT